MDRFVFDLTKLLLYITSILIIILAVTILVLSILTVQRTIINTRQNYALETFFNLKILLLILS
jgi:hypothetical protein